MKKYKISVDGILYDVEVEEVASVQMPLFSAPVAHATPAVHASAPGAPAAQMPAQFMQAPAPGTPATDVSAPATMRSGVETAPSSPASQVSDSSITIKAPMPGKVLSVEVTAGQQVAAGDVILVLEAMKMENEILAPAAGRVITIPVAKDAQVNTGDVLAVLG